MVWENLDYIGIICVKLGCVKEVLQIFWGLALLVSYTLHDSTVNIVKLLNRNYLFPKITLSVVIPAQTHYCPRKISCCNVCINNTNSL